jgi:hypothetical protein
MPNKYRHCGYCNLTCWEVLASFVAGNYYLCTVCPEWAPGGFGLDSHLRGDDTYPDPAKPGREGHKGILNAFEIRKIN